MGYYYIFLHYMAHLKDFNFISKNNNSVIYNPERFMASGRLVQSPAKCIPHSKVYCSSF